jgi:dephospho-CoA kinase
VAVTGGACTGKSTVLGHLESFGAVCFSADQFARDLTRPGSPLLLPLAAVAGRDVLAEDGSLVRRRLAQRIFADDALRRQVEAILHPPIMEAMRRASDADPHPIQCFEIPLLVESGLQELYDRVVLCRCGRAEQLRRLTERLAGNSALARRIIASQATDSERRPYADYVVMTNRPREAVKRRVERIFANLGRGLAVRV